MTSLYLPFPPAPQINLKTTQNKNEFVQFGNCEDGGLEAVGIKRRWECVRPRALVPSCAISGVAVCHPPAQDPTLQTPVRLPTQMHGDSPKGLKLSVRVQMEEEERAVQFMNILICSICLFLILKELTRRMCVVVVLSCLVGKPFVPLLVSCYLGTFC